MANLRARDFEFGTAKVIAFKGSGATVEGGFGPQVRFQTTNGNTLYLDPEPATDIERELQRLGVAAGESFKLIRAKTSHGGSRWVVERVGDAGGHNEPTRHAEASQRVVTMPAQNGAGGHDGTGPAAQPVTPAGAKFLSAYMVAIDTLIESQTYAKRKGLLLTVSCEDVRCLAATLIIDQKGGR